MGGAGGEWWAGAIAAWEPVSAGTLAASYVDITGHGYNVINEQGGDCGLADTSFSGNCYEFSPQWQPPIL